MSQRDTASAVDALKRASMNRDVSPGKASSSRKTSYSKAAGPSVVSPIRGATASRATDRAGSSNTNGHEAIPIFNLAKVRRNLEEQAVLATGVHNSASVLANDWKGEFVSGPAKAPGSSVAGSSSRIDKPRASISSLRSPRNRSYTDSDAALKRKPSESLAEYRRRVTLSDWRRDKAALNKRGSTFTSHQIVLPIQSPASSRRASMKVQPWELHFSRRSAGDNEPLTFRATTAPGTSEPAGQEARRPSASRREGSIEVAGDVSAIKSAGNVTKRALTAEGGKKPAQSMKFSSPRDIKSRDGLYGKHVYVQSEKSTASSIMGSHTARELHLGLEKILHEPEKDLKLKLKNIVARLRPDNMKAESQACYRREVESNGDIASLDEASEQQGLASIADMHQKSSKTKSLKVNLAACQIYEAPSRSSKGAHEQLVTPRSEDVQQQIHKIRPPKLNLGACQNYAAPAANSGRTHEQQASAEVGVVHKHKSRTRPSEVEYVDAWQTFVVDGGGSDHLHDYQEWVNGADVQLGSSKSKLRTNVAAVGSSDTVHEQQAPATCAHAQEQINETRPLKLKLGACSASIPHELVEKKSEKLPEEAEAFTSCRLQQLAFTNEMPSGQAPVEENGAQASLGRTLKQKLAEGSLSLNPQAEENKAVACPICGHSVEDIVHFLIKCVGYRSARDVLFQKIAELVPPGLFEEFSMLKSAAKASAIVSNVFWGANSGEVDIFVRGFLEKIWKVRECISNLLFEGLHGNLADYVQTSRTSRTVPTEASPKVVHTERSSRSPRKSSTTRSTDARESKSDASKPAAANLGACSALEKVGTENGAHLLKQYGQQLTKYEHREILQYTGVYFLGLQSQKIQPSGLPGDNNYGYDDERGDYQVKERDHVAYRYEVLGVLGKGSFGQVLKCNDHKHNVLRAVKIIRNKRRFHQQALVEVKILEHLRDKALEEPNNTNTVNIYESFQFRDHLCITFPLHDISLYEFIKRNSFQGMNLPLLKSCASQLLESLRFLRKLRVIHSDLKPENILLQQPQTSKIVVIDFGSSCFAHERVYTYIQSRFYRSPEVILGLPYDTMIDIWSLGCILTELFSGHPLFPGEDEVEQLACIMEMLGPPPQSVLENATRKNMFFDAENNPRNVQNSRGKKRLPGSRDLGFAIGCKDNLFVSFIESCLRWDKNRRLTPEELMQHPWMIAVSFLDYSSVDGSFKESFAPLRKKKTPAP